MRVLHPLATGLSAELESAGIYKDHKPLTTRELVPLTTPFGLVKKTDVLSPWVCLGCLASSLPKRDEHSDCTQAALLISFCVAAARVVLVSGDELNWKYEIGPC